MSDNVLTINSNKRIFKTINFNGLKIMNYS